jgi:predicted DNA-binding transcriptional regulator YafY
VTGEAKRTVEIRYTNHRGKTSLRQIEPARIWFGTSHWHEGAQWFLDAFDVGKGDFRSFALRSITEWRPAMIQSGSESVQGK